MTDPLGNYIRIPEGGTLSMHFVDHALGDREIADPLTGLVRPVTVLTMVVDEVDGRPQVATYSVTSAAHAADLAAYLPGRAYRGYTFVISRRGSGFGTLYSVTRIPRPPA